MMAKILDACCGSKMFWFDKNHPSTIYFDKREVENHEFYPGRYIEIKPDVVGDFTNLPFDDNSFSLVVFDPPHLEKLGTRSWTYLKYGRLDGDWRMLIHDGFNECMRVLKPDGVLIFKWSEVQIKLTEVLEIIGDEHKPLFGHRSGKHNKTHWITFMKGDKNETTKSR